MKKKTHVPTDEDAISFTNPRLILISAFRYALGRSTYMPSVIVGELIRNWDALSSIDRKQIQDDIRWAVERDMAGMDCDVREWKKILEMEV